MLNVSSPRDLYIVNFSIRPHICKSALKSSCNRRIIKVYNLCVTTILVEFELNRFSWLNYLFLLLYREKQSISSQTIYASLLNLHFGNQRRQAFSIF